MQAVIDENVLYIASRWRIWGVSLRGKGGKLPCKTPSNINNKWESYNNPKLMEVSTATKR